MNDDTWSHDTRARRRLVWAPAPWLLVVLAQSAAGDAALPEEYKQSFQGDLTSYPGWDFHGPDAAQRVRYQPDGVHISLPAGSPTLAQGVGLAAPLVVQGDFEMTVTFEILQEPRPQDAGLQTRVGMEIMLQRAKPFRNMAAISRKAASSPASTKMARAKVPSRICQRPGLPRSREK
jgi:hypothetical protein